MRGDPPRQATTARPRPRLRLRRRGLASINAELRDGVVPASETLQTITDTSAPAAGGGQTGNFRLIALIVACALFMEGVDATVLATALPTMARDFGVPVTNLSTALTAYLLSLAIFIPASGRFADRFGAKTVFRLAILVFLAGSLLCAQARNLPFLIFARFIQGAGGAMMIPIGRLVLLRSVRKEDMVAATSWLIMPALVGPIIGPPLGGFIVTYLDWRWIFYLNLPIGLLGVFLVTRFIAEIRGERPVKADVVGFVLSGVSLGCLLFGFERSSRTGELVGALVLIVIGLVAGGLYIAMRTAGPTPSST